MRGACRCCGCGRRCWARPGCGAPVRDRGRGRGGGRGRSRSGEEPGALPFSRRAGAGPVGSQRPDGHRGEGAGAVGFLWSRASPSTPRTGAGDRGGPWCPEPFAGTELGAKRVLWGHEPRPGIEMGTVGVLGHWHSVRVEMGLSGVLSLLWDRLCPLWGLWGSRHPVQQRWGLWRPWGCVPSKRLEPRGVWGVPVPELPPPPSSCGTAAEAAGTCKLS